MAGIDLRMYIDQVEESIDRLPRCSNCQYYDEKINSCNCDDWNKDCPLARFVKENNIFYSKRQKIKPERPQGKWIPHKEKCREYIGTVLVNVEYDYWFCDTCGYRVKKGQPMYNFCPYCGADMREKQDETSN